MPTLATKKLQNYLIKNSGWRIDEVRTAYAIIYTMPGSVTPTQNHS